MKDLITPSDINSINKVATITIIGFDCIALTKTLYNTILKIDAIIAAKVSPITGVKLAKDIMYHPEYAPMATLTP
jgi:hypothetical protein